MRKLCALAVNAKIQTEYLPYIQRGYYTTICLFLSLGLISTCVCPLSVRLHTTNERTHAHIRLYLSCTPAVYLFSYTMTTFASNLVVYVHSK